MLRNRLPSFLWSSEHLQSGEPWQGLLFLLIFVSRLIVEELLFPVFAMVLCHGGLPERHLLRHGGARLTCVPLRGPLPLLFAPAQPHLLIQQRRFRHLGAVDGLQQGEVRTEHLSRFHRRR